MLCLCALKDFNLTQEMSQMAIREVNGLQVLINLLKTNDHRCKMGSLHLLLPLTTNSKYNINSIIKLGGKCNCIKKTKLQLFQFSTKPGGVGVFRGKNAGNTSKSKLAKSRQSRYFSSQNDLKNGKFQKNLRKSAKFSLKIKNKIKKVRQMS